MMDNIAANQEKTKKKPLRQLAWLPIPFFLVLMIILWVLHLKGEYELPALMIIVNFLVRTLACLLIMYLVGRSFLVNGAPYLLMIGCGMAIWMASGFVSTASLSREANFGVTISNVGIWMAALCHLSGVILSIRSKRTIRPARLWLGVAYTLALGAAGLVVLATLAGWLPVFFIDGQGGTPVRYIILASAFTMFTLATILLWKANRPSLSSFVYWYMLALLLIAIGLLGMMVQSYRASLLDWVCRTSQYLSGIYMFIAAIASRRELKVHGITLTQAINEPIYRFGLTITVIAAATAVRLAFTPILRMHVPFLTFYPAVMVAALYGGLWTGLLATVLSTLTVNCFFIEPIGSSVINQPAVWLEIVAFCVSCMMLSFVTEAMHRAQAKLLSHQEYLEELVKARTLELEREIIERKRVEKDLQAKQQEITVANEELQAQWEKLIAANEELHAQTEELNFTYQELQCQTEEIRKHEKVTARARDEAEQRAAELDATISSIAAGVIIYDNMGNVIRVNDYAHVLYKLTSEDYQLSYQECLTGLQMHKSDGIAYATEEAPLKRALRGEVIRDEEMMMVTISEKPLWLSSTWAPIYSNSGNLMGVIFIFTDITESKRKAEDRLASERELLKVTLNSLGE
ncbi:MAG TPA: hypothetical protein DDW65_15935, partial [Firmicutes bacterium]|nr:hypothetical protein [Bacillota bacterium]